MSDKNKHKKYGQQKNSAQNKVYKSVDRAGQNKGRKLAKAFAHGVNLKQVRATATAMSNAGRTAGLKEGTRLYNKASGKTINWMDMLKA